MKNIIMAAVCFALCGCASVRIPTPQGQASAVTFLKTVDLPELAMSNTKDTGNGRDSQTLTVKGYKSRGDAATINAIGAACGIAVGNALVAAGMVP